MTIASFIPSVTGLNAMSHSLNTVSDNIVNMNTTGYKQKETLFNTLLDNRGINSGAQSGLHSSRVAITGVDAWDRNNVLQQGLIKNTGNTFDVAISDNSNAFFTVTDELGNVYYTRAGDFSKITTDGTTYLQTNGGQHVLGFKSIDGGNNFSVNTGEIIIDAPAVIPTRATTAAKIVANVPAEEVSSAVYTLGIYAENYNEENLHLVLTKDQTKPNSWLLSFDLQDGTVVADSSSISFNSDGSLKSPRLLNTTINWNNGATGHIAIDLSELTQFAASAQTSAIEQNGSPSADLVAFGFNKNGVLYALYDNSLQYNIAKLAITGFTAPENLTPYNATLYEANADVGNSFYVDTDELIIPNSIENSTVDLAEQFSKMIVTQRAYSLNAQSFTVNDEMLSLLVNLKS